MGKSTKLNKYEITVIDQLTKGNVTLKYYRRKKFISQAIQQLLFDKQLIEYVNGRNFRDGFRVKFEGQMIRARYET
jgi:hypothetical protein